MNVRKYKGSSICPRSILNRDDGYPFGGYLRLLAKCFMQLIDVLDRKWYTNRHHALVHPTIYCPEEASLHSHYDSIHVVIWECPSIGVHSKTATWRSPIPDDKLVSKAIRDSKLPERAKKNNQYEDWLANRNRRKVDCPIRPQPLQLVLPVVSRRGIAPLAFLSKKRPSLFESLLSVDTSRSSSQDGEPRPNKLIH